MQIGQKGVKYGLQLRGPNKDPKKAVSGPKPAAPKPVAAAFGGDSDSEEDDVGAQVARQAARKQSDAKVQEMYAAALAQDPSAFDYDGVYDSMQAEQAAPRHQERLERRPRYIATLVEQAQVRKKEQEIAFERQLLKEREKEDAQFDNEEKFVTAAYKRKLEEDKKWIEAQKQKELEEEQNDVRKLGAKAMGNFYQNLLTKNVAFGAPKQDGARDAGATEGGADAAGNGKREEPSSSPGSTPRAGEEAGPRPMVNDEEEGGSSLRAGFREAAAKSPGAERGASGPRGFVPGHEDGEDSGGGGSPRVGGDRGRSPVAAAATTAGGADSSGAEAASRAGKRKVDDAAVAAARERYLARKRQQLGYT